MKRALEDDAAQVASAIETAIKEDGKKPENRARRPNQQAFDEIVIRTVPRYKSSQLSGNEWRISAEVLVRRKGRTVYETSGSTVPQALQELAREVNSFEFGAAIDKVKVDDLCDQEGCAEPWTHEYSLHERACTSCGHKQPAQESWETEPPLRKFCARHAQRGNCGLEDAQKNYRVVKTPDGQPAGAEPVGQVQGADVSESAFGGVVFADSDSDSD